MRLKRAAVQGYEAHELVGWEARVWFQLLCLVGVTVCSAPLLAGELGVPLRLPLRRLADWLATREARETTGFVSGGIILFQASLSVNKRLLGGHVVHVWRTAHQVLPIGLLFMALLHTRGDAGVNLNRWLITVLLLQIYLVQAGHVAKAFLAEHASHPLLGRLNRAANGGDGLLHRVGLRLHVLLAVTVVILLGAHVFSVYYF